MNKNTKQTKAYVAPSVRVVSFTVERGFSASGGGFSTKSTGLEGLLSGSSGGVNDDYSGFYGPRPTQN